MWIDVPEGEKTYYGQCNQICGVNHAYMPIEVRALPEAEYKAWLKSAREEFAMNDTAPQVAPDAGTCLLYTSPSPRDGLLSRMPSSA